MVGYHVWVRTLKIALKANEKLPILAQVMPIWLGVLKYRFDDLRNFWSVHQKQTMRVAVGAVAKRLLAELDMEIKQPCRGLWWQGNRCL